MSDYRKATKDENFAILPEVIPLCKIYQTVGFLLVALGVGGFISTVLRGIFFEASIVGAWAVFFFVVFAIVIYSVGHEVEGRYVSGKYFVKKDGLYQQKDNLFFVL